MTCPMGHKFLRYNLQYLLISVLISGVLPRTASTQQTYFQVNPSSTAARDLYERAQYDDARRMLNTLIQQGNITAEILYYRGLVEPDALIAVEVYYDRVYRRYPGTEMASRALFKIAQYWYDSAMYIKARGLFGDVAWSQGDSPLGQAARYWRGMTWLHTSTEPDSLRIGLSIIKRAARQSTDPETKGRALLSTAELSLRLGKPDSALTYAAAVIEAPYLEDQHPLALGIQARAYDALGDMDQARIVNQMLVRRFPDIRDGREARRWLAQQREVMVQARLDSMRAIGTTGMTQSGAEEGRWSVQVGAFSNLGNATDLVMRLTSEGYNAWHATKRVDSKFFIIVLIGRFETRAEANAYGRSLRENSSSVPSFQLYEIKPQ